MARNKPDADGQGALSEIRVLDATQMLAGPLAGTRLGDLGADVIKLEPPIGGEFNRSHGFSDLHVSGEMTTFLAVNRNKRSVAIDLKHADSRDIVDDLVRSADVLIQNFRHGTADRLGIGWDRLSRINPRLIYCSISGYGSTGPYRDRPGQDLVVQGYSGSMFSVGGSQDPPAPGALWAADVMTGYQATIGILAALQARSSSGRGQHVEVDMLSVVLDAQLQEMVTFLNTGWQPTRSDEESAHAAIPAPYGVYKTADGWLTLAMSPLNLVGELLDDDWLRTLTHYNDGHIHRDRVYRHLRQAFVRSGTTEWIDRCDRIGIWAGPVYDYQDVADDPHVAAVGLITTQPHDGAADLRTVRPPLRMSDNPPTIRRGAPRLGADTFDVLDELGVSVDRIELLAAAGAINLGPAHKQPSEDAHGHR